MDFGFSVPPYASVTPTRILVVEDEGVAATDLEGRLTRLGYEVVAIADTAADAVNLAQSTKLDLILMEIHLRGAEDGIDAAGRLRQTVNVPVIFVTAHADETMLRRAGQTAPFGYVLKPFDERELRATIEMALYRHRTESRLRNMERWLAAIMASIGDGVIATDAEARINYMNARAEALSGWTRGMAAGKSLGEIFIVEDEAEKRVNYMPQLLGEVMKDGQVVNPGESRILRRRDHSRLAVDDSMAPIRDEDGTITGCVVVFRDATKRLEAGEERRNLQEKMHEAQRLESLGAIRTAELRAAGEALREAELDRMLKEDTQRRELATELHDFVGQDLVACRFKLGQVRRGLDGAHLGPVSECCELLDSAIQAARTLVFALSPPMLHEIGLASALDWLAERYTETYGRPVRFEQAEEIDPLPAATRVLFFQAARELLANAIKHADPTCITLHGSRHDGQLRLAAVNDGKGFAIDGRSDASPGFGLANIRERVRHFGGSLDIHSSSSGTTVELSVPLPVLFTL